MGMLFVLWRPLDPGGGRDRVSQKKTSIGMARSLVRGRRTCLQGVLRAVITWIFWAFILYYNRLKERASLPTGRAGSIRIRLKKENLQKVGRPPHAEVG